MTGPGDVEVVDPNETTAVTPDESPAPQESADGQTRAPGSVRRGAALLSGSGAVVWLGLLLVGSGFGLLVYTWSRVASTLDVAAQLTYIVSGGFSGLAVILVGLTLVILASKRRERVERERHLLELRDTLKDLSEAIGQISAGE